MPLTRPVFGFFPFFFDPRFIPRALALPLVISRYLSLSLGLSVSRSLGLARSLPPFSPYLSLSITSPSPPPSPVLSLHSLSPPLPFSPFLLLPLSLSLSHPVLSVCVSLSLSLALFLSLSPLALALCRSPFAALSRGAAVCHSEREPLLPHRGRDRHAHRMARAATAPAARAQQLCANRYGNIDIILARFSAHIDAPNFLLIFIF